MTATFRRSFAEINLANLRSNFQSIRARLEPGAFICPMIKANAYGHGSFESARALAEAGATRFGVALIEEGLELREQGLKEDILIFGTFQEEGAARQILENSFIPVISNWPQLNVLEKEAVKRSKRIKVHLKFNTGMNRLGFDVEDAVRLREHFDRTTAFELEGICTHLLRGEDVGVDNGSSQPQLLAFAAVLSAFRGVKFQAHALNSAAIVAHSLRPTQIAALEKDVIGPMGGRPGISLYGAQPSSEASKVLNLKPVLCLKSHLVSLHDVLKGESVSYNATWTAPRNSVIGVVPFGYADGYFRIFSNRSSVLCRGLRAPVVGTVCMDSFMVDLTDVASRTDLKEGRLRLGEEIVLLGEQVGAHNKDQIAADELAGFAGTISYEIFTHISSRVPRVYLDVNSDLTNQKPLKSK